MTQPTRKANRRKVKQAVSLLNKAQDYVAQIGADYDGHSQKVTELSIQATNCIEMAKLATDNLWCNI